MKGTTIALISCMFLALEPTFGKVLLSYMPPIVLAAVSSVFAALILFLVLEAEHKMREINAMSRRQFIVLLAVGIISGLLAQLFYVTGLRESTATNAVLLTRLNSLLIALMGVVMLREKLSINHVIGAILMVSGILLIATRNFTVDVKPTHGDGLLLLAAFFWASANILVKKYLSRIPPEVIVIGYYGFSGLILTAVSADRIPLIFEPKVFLYMTGLVVLVYLIGRYLWYYAFEHTSAANVGLASLSIPLFGVLYSTTLLGERLSSYHISGGLLIFLGLIVIELHLMSHKDVEHRLKRHHPHH
ncbi:MAG: DMT family transporter [Candidatus Altiarchaeota archaeon]